MKDKVKVLIKVDASCQTPEVVIRAAQETELVRRLAAAVARCAKSDAPRIAVFDGNSTVLLDQGDVLRVYTAPRKLMVCSDRGTYEARCSLKEMEKNLDPDVFVRISRFELINMERVSGFDVSLSGTIQVSLDDGSATFVARRYVSAVEQRLDQLSMRGGQADE